MPLLRVGKGIKKTLNFDRNELRFLFHCGILIPRKCPRKTHFNTQCPPHALCFGRAHCAVRHGTTELSEPGGTVC